MKNVFDKPNVWTDEEHNFMVAAQIMGHYGIGITLTMFQRYKALAKKLPIDQEKIWLPDPTEEEIKKREEMIKLFESMANEVPSGKGLWYHMTGEQQWEVWCEGYRATGEHGTAQLMGKVMAKSFDEAVMKLHNSGKIVLDMGDGEFRKNSEGRYVSWACAYFENEADARKSFG